MKKLLSISLLAAGIFAFSCNDSTGQQNVKIENLQDSVAYCIGMQIASQMVKDSINFRPEVISKAIKDFSEGKTTDIPFDNIAAVFQEMNKVLSAKLLAKQQIDAKKNIEEGEKFLAENKKRKEVKTTASGLQYEVIKSGNGKTPTAEQTVKVHYEGKLISGKIFDSSYQRNEPVEFGVTQVIPGWTEALQLMKEGDVWNIYLPSEIAYGEQGAGEDIGPNSVLIFKVELIEVK